MQADAGEESHYSHPLHCWVICLKALSENDLKTTPHKKEQVVYFLPDLD